MSTDRRMQLWGRIVEQTRDGPVRIEHVCAVMVAETGVDHVAVGVSVPANPRETMYASDEAASHLAELAVTLGEGPGVDAGSGDLVLVSDLTTADSLARWPAFAPAAVAAGIHAAFALPLQVGGIRLGVVDLYRDRPGPLDGERLTDGLMLADTACALLLDAADPTRPPDGRERTFEVASPAHPEVHQATGMVIVQLGVTAAVALVRLRAHAYATDRRLRDVAADVVARRLRFHPDQPDDAGNAPT